MAETLALPAASEADYPFYVAQEEDIKMALTSFRPESTSGPDGLHPEHLQTLLSGKAIEAGVRLLASLTMFENLMLKVEVPEFALLIMYGAAMFALSKKNGGIRPIAVGNTLRRLATKVGAKSISASIGEALRPVQLGASSKGG